MTATTNARPIAAAHAAMVAKLAAIIPPRLYASNDPEDFEATADYLLAVARVVDGMIRAVGEEVKSSANVRIDMDCFTDTLTHSLEGFATFEITRAADEIKAERAA